MNLGPVVHYQMGSRSYNNLFYLLRLSIFTGSHDRDIYTLRFYVVPGLGSFGKLGFSFSFDIPVYTRCYARSLFYHIYSRFMSTWHGFFCDDGSNRDYVSQRLYQPWDKIVPTENCTCTDRHAYMYTDTHTTHVRL